MSQTYSPYIVSGRFIKNSETLLISGAIALLGLALPIALLQIYDRVLPNNSTSTILLLVMGVGVAIALEAISRFGRAYLIAQSAKAIETRLSNNAFETLLNADLAIVESKGKAEVAEQFNAINQIREHYSGQYLVTLLDLIFAALFISLIWYLAGALVLVPLVMLFIAAATILFTNRSLERRLRAHAISDEGHMNFIMSVVSSILTIKGLALEGPVARRNEYFQEQRSAETQAIDQDNAIITTVSQVSAQIAITATVTVGCLYVIDGQLSTGGLAACTLLTGRAFQPLQGAASFWARMQSIKVAQARVHTLLSMPKGIDAENEASAAQISAGKLEVRDLSIAPPNGGTKILSNINFSVEPGEVVALTGANGSGKSFLLSALRGLTIPTDGEVLIDDIPMKDISSEEIESNVLFLPQYEAIFNGTILENLTMHRPELDNVAFEVAESLEFAETIQQFPEGFNTRLGTGGFVLPRGTAQRIAIGRALVSRPRILLFDEANSAVDDASDQAIKRMIETLRGQCTIILVTHRPSYMWLADRVHALSNGELESHGITVAGA